MSFSLLHIHLSGSFQAHILTMPPISFVPSYRSREASWFITSTLFLAGVINKNYQLLLYFKPSIFNHLPSALPSTCHSWVSAKICRANPLTSQWHTPRWALRPNCSVLQDQLTNPGARVPVGYAVAFEVEFPVIWRVFSVFGDKWNWILFSF